MKAFFITLISFLVINSVFALNPVREYPVTPADYGMDYNNIRVKTSDNMMLQVWFFKATDKLSRKVIILSDDGDGNMADLIEYASNFLSLGYNVVTYDYRGYGKSDDFPINNNFFMYSQFQKDLEGVLDWVKRDYPSLKTIHLFGLGIGGGLSIGIGCNRAEISRIIADSPYSTFELTEKRYMDVYGQKVMMPLGYDKTFLEPYYAMSEKGSGLQGILLICGADDKIFTPTDMKELYKLKKSITSIYTVAGATSKTTYTTSKQAYFAEIKKFLGQ
ncbi:MAG: alpha/beta hydrolase [Sphingobacteriales bacterium]|nr:alpha/beta hydrolase [Sphingobacteriales bacterium]